MTVDDVFSIRGRGTVVTGMVEEDELRVGDEVLINRATQVRVDGIEAFRKVLDRAEKGQNVGILSAKLDRSEVIPGDLLSSDGVVWRPRRAQLSRPRSPTRSAHHRAS